MNVYFVSSGYDGCFNVRCVLPMLENGWNGQWKGFNTKSHTEQEFLEGIKKADIVVFQRPLKESYYDLAVVLKKMGKKVVYDNDDTYIPESGTPLTMKGFGTEEQVKGYIAKIESNLKKFADISDLVTVSTEYLSKEYPKDKTIVLPNCVDIVNAPISLKNTSNSVRIGIQGSCLYSEDYKVIQGIINDLSKREDVTLVLFGLPPDTPEHKIQRESMYQETLEWISSIKCEWHPIVPITEYMNKLNELRLDILLIPRVENYFNKCKSNLKFLEASLLEIPCIVSSFSDKMSPYEVNKEDAKHVVLCSSESEWKYNIDNLISDKELRESIGKKAKEYIIKNYNIKDKAHLWVEAYTKLCH